VDCLPFARPDRLRWLDDISSPAQCHGNTLPHATNFA
jgi:hypothetical protein